MDAWNGFQILVDRADLVVRQVFEIRPWHDLEKVTIDGGHGRWVLRKAICSNRRGAVWMKVVKIRSMPNDFEESLKRNVPSRQSRAGGWRQVPRNNVGIS